VIFSSDGTLEVIDLISKSTIRSTRVQKPGRIFSLNSLGTLAAIPSGKTLCLYKLEDLTLIEQIKVEFPLTGVSWESTRGTLILYGGNEIASWNYHLKGDPTKLGTISSEVQFGRINSNGAEFYCIDVEGNLHIVSLPQVQMQDILFKSEPQSKETIQVDGEEKKPKKKQKRFDQLVSDEKTLLKKKKIRDELEEEEGDFEKYFSKENSIQENIEAEESRPQYTLGRDISEIEVVFAPNRSDWIGDVRWLAFTNLGRVISRKVGESTNIDIEFHDIRSHRPVRFVDDLGLEFCSIDSTGAIFGGGQNIKFVPFSGGTNWTTKHTWTLQLDPGETVKGVTLRDERIIVLTSKGYLRPMSTTGIQLQPIVAPNGALCPILANNGILVICHRRDGYETILFDSEINQIASFPFRNDFLWVGLDEGGNCFGAMDKDFTFFILESNGWKPIFKAELPTNEKFYWPVSFGIDGIKVIISTTNPIPLPNSQLPVNIETVPFQVPLASASDPIVQINSAFLINSILKSTLSEKELKKANNSGDKLVLELFQMAIKCDQLERALQLISLLTNPKSLEIATQLARHARLITLVDKINNMTIPSTANISSNGNNIIFTSDTTVQNNPSSQHLFSKPLTAPTSPASLIQDSYVMPNTIESSGYDLSQLLINRENTFCNKENLNTFTSGLDSQATQLPTFSSQPRKNSILSDPFADDSKRKEEPSPSGGGYLSAIHKLQRTMGKK
jgi:hypothetical protein